LNGEAVGRLEYGRAGGTVYPLGESGDAAMRHRKPEARFVWPMASAAAKKIPTYIMPVTPAFEFGTADELKAVLARVAAPRTAAHLTYADAVAVAGLCAAATQRPRAVVLLIAKHGRELAPLDTPPMGGTHAHSARRGGDAGEPFI
jgi:hypothetical protein